jgi:NAD(P)-dependent dehydrogenase (short-subunit alcohol dehydrogenase family)
LFSPTLALANLSLWRRHRRALRQTIQHQRAGRTVYGAKALPLLKNGGSIILNGSVASVKGTAAFGVYAASKAAIRSLVRTSTTDLKDRGIRSNVVSPGPIDTPLASRQSPEVIARIVCTIPMGRMGKPEEVAKVGLFLASDDYSFVTGIELFVDGARAQV